jgi:hypothetical protein
LIAVKDWANAPSDHIDPYHTMPSFRASDAPFFLSMAMERVGIVNLLASITEDCRYLLPSLGLLF